MTVTTPNRERALQGLLPADKVEVVRTRPTLQVHAVEDWHEAGGCKVAPGWDQAVIGGVLHDLDWTDVDLAPRPATLPSLRVERAGDNYLVRFPGELPASRFVRTGDETASDPDGTAYRLDWSRADSY